TRMTSPTVLLVYRRPPRSTPFPYTTLFRSHGRQVHRRRHRDRRVHDRDAALDHPLPRRSLGGRPALPRGRRRHRRGHPIPAPAHGRDPTRVRSAHPHDGGRPMTSTHAPLETTSPLGFARRFLSRRASWLPVFAALALLIVIFVAAQAYFGNFLT